MLLLVFTRIGGPRSARDLIHPPSRGALEILVDRYLAEEQLQLARRRLAKERRKLAKAAKVVSNQSVNAPEVMTSPQNPSKTA